MMTHSFTFKFIFSCGLISTIVLLITTYFTYQISIAEMEKLLGERLSSIAINTQSEINIEDHETLFYYFLAQKKELSSTTEFKKLQKTLQEIKRRNNLKSHIYTMVLDPSFPTRAIFMGMSNKKIIYWKFCC